MDTRVSYKKYCMSSSIKKNWRISLKFFSGFITIILATLHSYQPLFRYSVQWCKSWNFRRSMKWLRELTNRSMVLEQQCRQQILKLLSNFHMPLELELYGKPPLPYQTMFRWTKCSASIRNFGSFVRQKFFIRFMF